MRKIIIESCLNCPYLENIHKGIKVLDICEKSGKEIKDIDNIPNSCPYKHK